MRSMWTTFESSTGRLTSVNLPDLINGAFELAGGLATWLNVKRLLRDKQVRGVYWPIWILMTAWGFWNLYYYTQLGQIFSLLGGIALAFGNLVWVVMAVYYGRNNG